MADTPNKLQVKSEVVRIISAKAWFSEAKNKDYLILKTKNENWIENMIYSPVLFSENTEEIMKNLDSRMWEEIIIETFIKL